MSVFYRKCNNVIAFLIYSSIYATYVYASILTFVPQLSFMEYKYFVALVNVMCMIISLLWYAYFRKVPRTLLLIVLTEIIILILYIITGLRCGINNIYISEGEVYIAQVIPVTLTASLAVSNVKIYDAMKYLISFFGFLFTLVALFSSFFPTSSTSGGFAATNSGLNYQTISYMAAYGTGFLILNIIIKGDMPYFKRFVHYIAILGNLMSILLAGGNGGLVLWVVESAFYLVVVIKINNFDKDKMLSLTIGILLAVIVMLMIIDYAANSNLPTSGFKRVVKAIVNRDTNGRSELYKYAFESFLGSPLIGHSFGSVFFEVGHYSHNLFLDTMVETGIIGLMMEISFFIIIAKKCFAMIAENFENVVLILFFLHGFVVAMFSGYYLLHLPFIWSVCFVIFYPKNKNKTNTIY